METQPEGLSEVGWPQNYFNYFTEVEEHFQKARGTGLFLLSPLDWALIESWKNAGIPLLAVIRGIDLSFEMWRTKKRRGREVNSLAYCSQAVLEEAERLVEGAPAGGVKAEAPFTLEEVEGHLRRCAAEIRTAGIGELSGVAEALVGLASETAEWYEKLEALENRLTGLEDRMIAVARAAQSEEEAMSAREELERQLRPHRGKMTAPQIAMLEKQFLDRQSLERLNLPRLSLFYLR